MPRWVLVREIGGVVLLLVAGGLWVTLLVMLAVYGAWGLFALGLGATVTSAAGMTLARWDPDRWRPGGGTVAPYQPTGDDARPVRMPRLPK